jgi:DNA-binding XRE family transcriptional regulator
MILTELEYRNTKKQIAEYEQKELEQIQALKEKGLSDTQIEFVLSPSRSQIAQMKWEVEEYERYKRGDFSNIAHAAGIGRLLIAMRIYRGLTQAELAQRLGVTAAQVSKDERNEYYNVTHQKMLQVLRALGMDLELIPREVAATEEVQIRKQQIV